MFANKQWENLSAFSQESGTSHESISFLKSKTSDPFNKNPKKKTVKIVRMEETKDNTSLVHPRVRDIGLEQKLMNKISQNTMENKKPISKLWK